MTMRMTLMDSAIATRTSAVGVAAAAAVTEMVAMRTVAIEERDVDGADGDADTDSVNTDSDAEAAGAAADGEDGSSDAQVVATADAMAQTLEEDASSTAVPAASEWWNNKSNDEDASSSDAAEPDTATDDSSGNGDAMTTANSDDPATMTAATATAAAAAPPAITPSPWNSTTDCMVLRDIFSYAGGDLWKNATGWNAIDANCCANASRPIFGIGCDYGAERVLMVKLADNNLQGTLPDSISRLDRLTSFNVSNNKGIMGSIPAGLFEIPSLRILDLSDNRLGGSLPDTFPTSGAHIDILNIENNHIQGPLPAFATPDYPSSMCRLRHNHFSCVDSAMNIRLCKVDQVLPQCQPVSLIVGTVNRTSTRVKGAGRTSAPTAGSGAAAAPGVETDGKSVIVLGIVVSLGLLVLGAFFGLMAFWVMRRRRRLERVREEAERSLKERFGDWNDGVGGNRGGTAGAEDWMVNVPHHIKSARRQSGAADAAAGEEGFAVPSRFWWEEELEIDKVIRSMDRRKRNTVKRFSSLQRNSFARHSVSSKSSSSSLSMAAAVVAAVAVRRSNSHASVDTVTAVDAATTAGSPTDHRRTSVVAALTETLTRVRPGSEYDVMINYFPSLSRNSRSNDPSELRHISLRAGQHVLIDEVSGNGQFCIGTNRDTGQRGIFPVSCIKPF